MGSTCRERSPGRALSAVGWLAMPLQFLQGTQPFLTAKDVYKILRMAARMAFIVGFVHRSSEGK